MTEMGEFAGRVALITGGASGIGAATARAFARRGASVVIGDLGASRVAAAAADMGVAGTELDVTGVQSCRDFHAWAREEAGLPDILVNCAGIREIQPFVELAPEEFDRVLAVNLSGTFYLAQVFAQALIAAETPGSIVNLTSSAGLMGVPNRAAYVAAKHGVVGLTKEMAMELGPHGIRVNAVAPGSVRTPLTEQYFSDPEIVARLHAGHPLGRVASPEEIAASILFLAGDSSGFTTGAILPVDGGYTAGKGW